MIGFLCLWQCSNTFSHLIDHSSWAMEQVSSDDEKKQKINNRCSDCWHCWECRKKPIMWFDQTWSNETQSLKLNCRIEWAYTHTHRFHVVYCRLEIGLCDKIPTQILEGVNFDSVSLPFHFGHWSFGQYNQQVEYAISEVNICFQTVETASDKCA